ncbi:thiamine diphosphokinase [Alphaproteobacteria bacterium]|jgi:thiamine pyrophosphokinase|nr:thiamine diphosphokinase [Alphaproteobacteria bacterium]
MKEWLLLKFENPIALVGGGWVDWHLLEQLVERGYALVAADGAINELVARGFLPDAVIGDMDSIADDLDLPSSVVKVALPEQSTTDFEKCLYSTESSFYVGLGFLGRRLDHSLASLSVLAKYTQLKKVVLVDEVDLIFGASGEFSIAMPVSARFSIFPLSECHFTASEGLAYPLNDLTLKIGALVGTSNKTIAESVRVFPAPNSDPYAVLLAKEHLSSLIAAC